MSRKVQRSDIVDWQTYDEERPHERQRILEIKRVRRVHVGDVLTFLFENRDTVRYQIQEMMRAERIVKEAAIQHEIETYNQLVGGDGELGCSLLIEIDDPERRRRCLSEWIELPQHLYVRLEDGSRVGATYDPRQVGDERLSAVQYLTFKTGGRVPVAVGTDFPPLSAEQPLTSEQRAALAADLQPDSSD